MYISINGQLIKENYAFIPPDSEGFLYGYGAFETIKFENKKIYFFKEHIKRLQEGCNKLRIQLEFDSPNIEGYCYELLDSNNLESGVLKILNVKNGHKNDLILTIRENIYTDENYIEGFKLCFTHIKRNPYSLLTYIKSNNYMENLIARQQGLDMGYNEVVFENIHEKLCEGAISNIFFIKDDIIYTPSIECGILPGIMRNKVVEAIKALNLKIEIGEYTREDILKADEIFITNSLLEIMPIAYLQDKKLNMTKNLITQRLIKEFRKYLTKQT